MTVTGELISRLFSVTLDRNGQAPGIEEAAREGAKAAARTAVQGGSFENRPPPSSTAGGDPP